MKIWNFRLALLGLGLIMVACGPTRSGTRPEGGLLNARGEGGLFHLSGSRGPDSSAAAASLNQEIGGVRIKNKDFDLPVEYTKEVERWVDYFTGTGRRHFAVYMERKAKMEPIILPRLREAGLPEDLIYLAMIESGFSTAALSHAGAMGPWQFIRSTGRMYGLQQDWWRDERRDPIKSTEAAIQYLTRLYEEFGDWRLACSAYNSGELRIRRAISNLGTRDFWTINRDRKALRQETKDYIPKIFAAAIVGKNAEQFGFRTFPADTALLEYEEVRIPKAENLQTIAKVANVSRARLAELNPELMRCCTPPQRGAYTIRVPRGESARLVAAAVDAGELGRFSNFRRHVVRRGDTLSRIASSNGVPVQAILSMNDIRNAGALRVGMQLVIPDRGGAPQPARAVASSSSRRAPKGHRAVTHVVRKGDTLYGISRRYDVRVEEIRRWNSIRQVKNLRPGHRIKLYVRNENSESI